MRSLLLSLVLLTGCAAVRPAPVQLASAGWQEHGQFCVTHLRWGVPIAGECAPNKLTQEGQAVVLSCFLRGQCSTAANANFYVGVMKQDLTKWPSDLASLNTSVTLAGLATYCTGSSNCEGIGTGYQRMPVQRSASGWPAASQVLGNWSYTTGSSIFAPSSGTWGAIKFLFLTDAASGNTGAIISVASMANAYVLTFGDSLSVTYTVALQ